MTARVMLPRVFPEGTSEGGRGPAALGGTRTGCSITPRTSHGPAGLAARVTAASGMFGGAERRSSGELLEWDEGCFSESGFPRDYGDMFF